MGTYTRLRHVRVHDATGPYTLEHHTVHQRANIHGTKLFFPLRCNTHGTKLFRAKKSHNSGLARSAPHGLIYCSSRSIIKVARRPSKGTSILASACAQMGSMINLFYFVTFNADTNDTCVFQGNSLHSYMLLLMYKYYVINR